MPPSAPSPAPQRPTKPQSWTRSAPRCSPNRYLSQGEQLPKGRAFFRIALAGYDPHVEALAFKSPAVADSVAKVMNDMKADGTFEKIFAPYGHCVLPGPYKVTTGSIPRPVCSPAER